MLKQAQRRDASAVRLGKVKLLCQSVADLKRLDGRFDRVFSANVAQFWDDRVPIFREILGLLALKAKVATTFQPRHPKATDQDAVRFGALILEEMNAAGLPVGPAGVRTESAGVDFFGNRGGPVVIGLGTLKRRAHALARLATSRNSVEEVRTNYVPARWSGCVFPELISGN